jgi:hypothetical protein
VIIYLFKKYLLSPYHVSITHIGGADWVGNIMTKALASSSWSLLHCSDHLVILGRKKQKVTLNCGHRGRSLDSPLEVSTYNLCTAWKFHFLYLYCSYFTFICSSIKPSLTFPPPQNKRCALRLRSHHCIYHTRFWLFTSLFPMWYPEPLAGRQLILLTLRAWCLVQMFNKHWSNKWF